jgi:putative endonuclease
MKINSQTFGKTAEAAAKEYLVSQGYVILATNWRFKRYEIDIIARTQDVIVFVEVKGRSSAVFGEPEVFVTKSKQNFLTEAAHRYLQAHEVQLEARFDIVAVLQFNNKLTVKHLPAAFYPSLK